MRLQLATRSRLVRSNKVKTLSPSSSQLAVMIKISTITSAFGLSKFVVNTTSRREITASLSKNTLTLLVT